MTNLFVFCPKSIFKQFVTFSNTSEILIFLPLWTWVNSTKKQNGPAQNINIMEYQGFFLRRPSMRWTLPEKNKLNFTVNITECKVILRSQPTTSYLSLTQAKHLKNLDCSKHRKISLGWVHYPKEKTALNIGEQSEVQQWLLIVVELTEKILVDQIFVDDR